MSDKQGYEAWLELFRQEQKGKSPEDMMYQPVPEISTLPYLVERRSTIPSSSHGSTTPSFFNRNDKISHSFVIDVGACFLIWDLCEKLKLYHIKAVYGDLNVMTERKELKALQSINPEDFVGSLPGDDDAPLILDFGNKFILEHVKDAINTQLQDKYYIWITPGDDFLWNIALIRAIRKYLNITPGQTLFFPRMSIYLPLQESEHK